MHNVIKTNISSFETVNIDGKTHYFVTEIVPRELCVFYEEKNKCNRIFELLQTVTLQTISQSNWHEVKQ